MSNGFRLSHSVPISVSHLVYPSLSLPLSSPDSSSPVQAFAISLAVSYSCPAAHTLTQKNLSHVQSHTTDSSSLSFIFSRFLTLSRLLSFMHARARFPCLTPSLSLSLSRSCPHSLSSFPFSLSRTVSLAHISVSLCISVSLACISGFRGYLCLTRSRCSRPRPYFHLLRLFLSLSLASSSFASISVSLALDSLTLDRISISLARISMSRKYRVAKMHRTPEIAGLFPPKSH